MKKRMDDASKGAQKRNRNKNLTPEERINSALLYTPEIYTWTDKRISRD